MPDCPRCHQPVEAQAVACPYCHTALKAFGHPGIPLYRAAGKESLCQSCIYHIDDTCNFPQRPHARECTLYQNQDQPVILPEYKPRLSWQAWLQRHAVWIVVVGLLVVSLLLALSNR
jgi:hypothetical protein